MGNLLPPLGPALAAFGVAATVIPKGGTPVVTTVIRLRGASPPAVGTLGMSAAAAVDLRPVVSIPRSAVPELPPGSTLEADFGDGPEMHRIDRVDDDLPDEWRAVISRWPTA